MSDFYQSQADKLRFEILLKSLREGRLNLAILGDDEAALTHYGKRIFQHLRQLGEPNVELWTSADSERLVDRFNEILSTLTVDQALDKTNQTAPKRYMIFPDTHGIQDFELQLLARLVNGFPASNINVILLVNSRSTYDKKLSAFGKNLLQWVLESQAPALAKAARLETLGDWPGAKQVASDKKPAATLATSDDVALPSVPPPPLDLSDRKTTTSADSPAGLTDPELGEPVLLSDFPSGEELAKSWEANAAAAKRSGRWAMVSLFVLLVSVVVFGVINQERVLEEWEGMRSYLSGTKPLPESPLAASAPAVPPPPSVSMSSSDPPVVKPSEALSPDKEELVTPNIPEPVAVTTTTLPASEVAKVTPETVAPVVVEPPKKSQDQKPADKATAEKSPTEKPPLEKKPTEKKASNNADKSTQADNASWVAQLDPNAWVMQHGAFDSLNEARQFQGTSLGFKSGQVLFTQRKGSKPYYILVTGPYADKAQAQTLMKENPPLAKAWLRTTKSLQAQFQD